MTVHRRAFIAGATLLTVAPGLQLLPVAPSARAASARRTALMIDGWSSPGDSDSEGGDEVWIRVDRSWRSAWR